MTQDEIIRLAREAGYLCLHLSECERLEMFAKLVAQAEREACAKVCETLWNHPENGMATEEQCYGDQCAAAIRARGNVAKPE